MAIASASLELRVWRRFLRRWRLAVLGILLTIGLCYAVTTLVPVSYSAKAEVLLTPPATSATDGNPNPYLALGGMQPLADIMGRAMTSSAMLTQLRQSGLAGSYDVFRDSTVDGPLLTVTTTGTSARSTLRDLNLVLARIAPRLDRLQTDESVPARNRVTSNVISRDDATVSRKSQIRALVVAAVGGLVATALAVSIIDIVMLRRRERTSARQRPTPRARSSSRLRSAVVHDRSHLPAASRGATKSEQKMTIRALTRLRSFVAPESRQPPDEADQPNGHVAAGTAATTHSSNGRRPTPASTSPSERSSSPGDSAQPATEPLQPDRSAASDQPSIPSTDWSAASTSRPQSDRDTEVAAAGHPHEPSRSVGTDVV